MFNALPDPGTDPILRSALVFQQDPAPHKIDMGIGIYKDDYGHAPVMASVKAAERRLVEEQETKAYLSGAGNAAFNEQVRGLLFPEAEGGKGSDAGARAVTIQTPGGTGALRVAADFLRGQAPGAKVWIPAQSWPNHRHLFGTVGFRLAEYPWFDVAAGRLDFDRAMAAFHSVAPGDVVILHGCCQNPTGADPDAAQWGEIAQVLAQRAALPIVDIAYQGLGDGLAEDARGLATICAALPEVIVASSCSKNFALYRERTGALSFVGETRAAAEKASGHALHMARANYSMPPDHGAAVVAMVLSDPGLRALWSEELAGMRARMGRIRAAFAARLSEASGKDFGHIAHQKGLFATVPLTAEMAARLRAGPHIHASATGRLNLAGLTAETVAPVAAAIGAELRELTDA